MRQTNTYCSYACGASKFQMYFFYFSSAKDLSHYPPCFERRSDLSNIALRFTEGVHVSIGNEY